jgi:hypothetical protein
MTSLFVVAMRLRTRTLPTPRKAKPRSVVQKAPPLKEGRRSADRRVQDPHREEMRRASFLLPPFTGGPRPPGPHGAGALAFRRPTAASEVLASARLGPRFLEPPDANGRTLSGTSAASTSRSGTRRTGRCPSRPRAQCMAALNENRSRSASRSTLAKGVLRERDFGDVTIMGTKVKSDVTLLRTTRRAACTHECQAVAVSASGENVLQNSR